jgi:hypothetical protein
MVFLMAAIVAIMLYQQLPRVAFESERDKEQLLIDRGEQYIRAIQLYYVANNRQWPTSIEDLEKKEKRFLRKRYVDPYTGKDEWRIIHTSGGFLTDSLVQKPPGASDSQNASNTTTPTDGQPQVNAAVLQRPSDRPVTPPPGFAPPISNPDPTTQAANTPFPPITLQPQQGPGALPPITLQPGAINQPGGLPPITLATTTGPIGQPAGGQQLPGQGRGAQGFPGQSPVAPFPGLPSPAGQTGGAQPGVPPGFRMDANGQLVPITATPVPGQAVPGLQSFPGQPQGIPGLPQQPGNQNGNQPVNQPGAPGSPNAALNLINTLLTSPRQTTSTPIASSGNQVGAIAGIASTHKGPSIKVYKDQDQYELWEFVFTPTASTVPGGGAGGTGAPGNGQGRGGQNQPGNGTQPSFGNQPGFANQPGFGNQPGGSNGGPGRGTQVFGPGNGQQVFAPGPGR